MYIPPNTTLYILKNVPLNSDYENTVYYPNLQSQVEAFMQYRQITLENYSYQRAGVSAIRVQVPFSALYQCNYLMFKNNSYENKWYFCFIENVSYVSNDVSTIYYKIDVLQTWCYDYHFLNTFVERHHAKYDRLFENIQPEGLDLGQYYTLVKRTPVTFRDNAHFVIIISDISGIDNLGAPNQTGSLLQYADTFNIGGMLNGVMNGLVYITFPLSRNEEMRTFLRAVNNSGKGSTVVNFYVAPCAISATSNSYTDFTVSGALSGYVPKNKKLYNSPFHLIQLENNNGQSVILNPEQFTNNRIEWSLQEIAFPEAGVRLYPTNYIGLGNPIDYSCIYMNFPVCSFASNTYAMWWSQNKNSYLQSLAALDASYDMNSRIAQNNYDAANRSARASMQMANTTNASQLRGAMTGIEASRANATGQANFTRNANIARGAMGAASSAFEGDIGGALYQGAETEINNMQNGLNWHNQMRSLGAQQAQAEIAAGANQANAQLALDTALQNNALNFANANLSNLTNKNNAVNALMAKKRDIENIPNTAKINASADSLNWGFNQATFYINEFCLKDEYLQRVDDYFTCYGYSQSSLYTGVRLDERVNREHFSYLKTVGCNITGALNDQDLTVIRSIYDNGITTWDTLENVGHYEISNNPKN